MVACEFALQRLGQTCRQDSVVGICIPLILDANVVVNSSQLGTSGSCSIPKHAISHCLLHRQQWTRQRQQIVSDQIHIFSVFAFVPDCCRYFGAARDASALPGLFEQGLQRWHRALNELFRSMRCSLNAWHGFVLWLHSKSETPSLPFSHLIAAKYPVRWPMRRKRSNVREQMRVASDLFAWHWPNEGFCRREKRGGSQDDSQNPVRHGKEHFAPAFLF